METLIAQDGPRWEGGERGNVLMLDVGERSSNLNTDNGPRWTSFGPPEGGGGIVLGPPEGNGESCLVAEIDRSLCLTVEKEVARFLTQDRAGIVKCRVVPAGISTLIRAVTVGTLSLPKAEKVVGTSPSEMSENAACAWKVDLAGYNLAHLKAGT